MADLFFSRKIEEFNLINKTIFVQTLLTESVSEAAAFLLKGELVAFPTETVYGLGAIYSNDSAIQKIYQAKGRPADNPLILHVSKAEQLKQFVGEINLDAKILIEHFWPGPLSIVFKKHSDFDFALNTIAIRMPAHPVALALINEVGPVFAPSANLSGKPSSTHYRHVMNDFDGKIPCILKGEVVKGLESTVVDCSGETTKILRLGSLTVEEIQDLLPNIECAESSNPELPLSPGMKYKHYAPAANVHLLSASSREFLPQSAFIGFKSPSDNFATVKLVASVEEYAANLFSFFRECDELGVKNIFCESPPSKGIGRALLERIKKACSKK